MKEKGQNNMKVLGLTRNQSLAVRKLIKYMGYNVFPYANSNLIVSRISEKYHVSGINARPTKKYTINEFLKDLNERKKV